MLANDKEERVTNSHGREYFQMRIVFNIIMLHEKISIIHFFEYDILNRV